MSEPFIGEIRTFAFNFAPVGWALCNGQLMAIAQNQALFSLLGTQFGGDGFSTFALPNLQSRIAIHQGQGSGLSSYTIGETGGAETVTLTTAQMPNHTHQLFASSQGATRTSPAGSVLAAPHVSIYAPAPNETAMSQAAIGHAGSSQPFGILPPFLALTFCIALFGIFPARN